MGVIFTYQVVGIIQQTWNKHIKYCTNLLYLIFSISLRGWTSRQNSPPVRECLSANTKWLETVNLLFNLSTTYFMEDMERASFHNFIITYIWCFGRCLKPSCVVQREKIFPSCSFSWWKWDLIQSKICIIPSNISSFVFFYPANVRK